MIVWISFFLFSITAFLSAIFFSFVVFSVSVSVLLVLLYSSMIVCNSVTMIFISAIPVVIFVISAVLSIDVFSTSVVVTPALSVASSIFEESNVFNISSYVSISDWSLITSAFEIASVFPSSAFNFLFASSFAVLTLSKVVSALRAAASALVFLTVSLVCFLASTKSAATWFTSVWRVSTFLFVGVMIFHLKFKGRNI